MAEFQAGAHITRAGAGTPRGRFIGLVNTNDVRGAAHIVVACCVVSGRGRAALSYTLNRVYDGPEEGIKDVTIL